MAAIEAAAIVASSGVLAGALQSTSLAARTGRRQTRQWLDRMLGLKLLKSLPRGLEALVYGDKVTPELLAALSMGGEPGHELSTLALLISTDWSRHSSVAHRLSWLSGVKQLSIRRLLGLLFEEPPPPPAATSTNVDSHMDGDLHNVHLLDDHSSRKMRMHICSSQAGLYLKENAYLAVVGYVPHPHGVVVHGSTDGRFYYCENRFGQLQCSLVDTCPEGGPGLVVTSTNNGSSVFTVAPRTLDSYPEFFRMRQLMDARDPGIREILGLAEVARSLGLSFAAAIVGGDSNGLLSRRHLRKVHNRLGRDRAPLQMPRDIPSLVRDALEALPLCERKYKRARFSATQETTAAYTEAIRTVAETAGNVGVRLTESDQSCLIKSCVVEALGLEPSFAVFPRFSSSRVNIGVSPGCTAIYFPVLNITVAFPEGFAAEAGVRRTFRPACPFTSDLSETLPILVDLAPRIGNGRLRYIASVLSKELAADPSLALDPVTENVVRSFATRVGEAPAPRSLIALLRASTLGEGRLHREAAVAGVLCQLGVTFSVADGADMRCFFHCCREAGWGTARGNVGVVLVDCKVDIFGCHAYETREGTFLGNGRITWDGYYAKIKGPGLEKDRLRLEDVQQGGSYHLESADRNQVAAVISTGPFPVKCYVGSRRTAE